MKKIVMGMLAALTAFSLCACGASSGQEKNTVVVFAAASMEETLEQIAEDYAAVEPNVKLVFNFDSSGALKTQIQEGADCDLFLSAGQRQMNQLDSAAGAEKNPEGLDLIASESRVDLLENEVTLVVPEGNPKGIDSFETLAQQLRAGDAMLSMGNSDVPVGQYTQKILAYFDLAEEDIAKAGHITYATNVKEVVTQVKEGSVDAGVVYCTDAFSDGLTIVDRATAEMCGQVIYPAAVTKHAAHAEDAQKFLDYLKTAPAMERFEKVGFRAVS